METYEKKEKRQFNKYDMAIGLFYGVGIFLGIGIFFVGGFIKRFFFGETVKAISKDVDIPSLKISNMLFKTKKKLRSFLNSSDLI